MANDEDRPLLYQRHSRLSKQPSPERLSSYRREHRGRICQTRTIINLINVLVGVGLLSLPLAMRYAGWIAGICILTTSALFTGHAAKLLARCMDTNPSLETFVDIAEASFGTPGLVATMTLFSLNMLSVCVALVILFGDTMALLVPSLSVVEWKIICGFIILPMQFISFRILALVSVVGVLSCIGVVGTTIVAGLVNPRTPGSLFDPARTSLTPPSLLTLGASIGLFMSPWGASASFPTFYRDMKKPQAYDRCLSEALVLAYVIDIAMLVSGYLMFGEHAEKEITYNILSLASRGYPHALLGGLIGFTAAMPITKITLSSRPLIIMIEHSLLSIDIAATATHPDQIDTNEDAYNDYLSENSIRTQIDWARQAYRAVVRFVVIVIIVVVSIAVPGFDWVISLMGSALCYAISVILPLLFHIKLKSREYGRLQKVMHWSMVVICSMLAITGTACALMT